MTLCYFDIETTGVNPRLHKIITIQYQCIEERTLKPLGDLVILKEWESSEREILKDFLNVFIGGKPFDFIPIGVNLMFDFRFLYHRVKYLIPQYVRLGKITLDYLIWEKPFIDLKPILVMLNNFGFKDYSKIIDKYMKINIQGKQIPYLYVEGKYEEIEAYIREEAKVTIEFLRKIYEFLKGFPKP